jgi:hypothetical protein
MVRAPLQEGLTAAAFLSGEEEAPRGSSMFVEAVRTANWGLEGSTL